MRGAVLERKKLVDDYYQDYKGANYDKALKYFYENSYRELKISGDYVTISLLSVNCKCSAIHNNSKASELASISILSCSGAWPGYSCCWGSYQGCQSP